MIFTSAGCLNFLIEKLLKNLYFTFKRGFTTAVSSLRRRTKGYQIIKNLMSYLMMFYFHQGSSRYSKYDLAALGVPKVDLLLY